MKAGKNSVNFCKNSIKIFKNGVSLCKDSGSLGWKNPAFTPYLILTIRNKG